MFSKSNFESEYFYLTFLKNQKTKNNPQTEFTFSPNLLKKINTFEISEKLLRIIKIKSELNFIYSLNVINIKTTTHNTANINPLVSHLNGMTFYSGNININLLNYKYKNNFSVSQVINLGLYINIKKYFFIFYENKKNLNLNDFMIADVPSTFQEIIEIKPDKTKKVYFKKKQIKTFTYLNEINKNYVYTEIDDVDAKLFEKDLIYKNIFTNSISNNNQDSSIFNVHSTFSNKPLVFWKKSKRVNKSSNLILDNFVSIRSSVKCIVVLQYYYANSLDTETSLLHFNLSINFAEVSAIKADRAEFYKNLFLYNFINLFSKITPIDYNQNYAYINHVTEFKDYFSNKINPLSRDLTVHKNKNKNKFNNFFPLYCLSFKKFKKLILFSKKQQSPAYSAYYMYYLVNFLELMCKKKIWIRINTKKQVSDDVYSKFSSLFVKNKADQINIGKHFFLIEFYEIVYLSFINRDINFFAMWFKKIMEKIHLKKHRKMVKIVHSTIRNNSLFLELTGVKGFSMDVRGKLGTAGNSKKKHYAFTVGSIAPTTKSHGLNLYQTTVRTSTGVLGVTILMSY